MGGSTCHGGRVLSETRWRRGTRICAPPEPRDTAPEGETVFTGIVEELGELAALEYLGDSALLTVRASMILSDAKPGDSIAVNGVCLTVTKVGEGQFTADVMGETLKCSSLGSLGPGTAVNLERAVRADGRLGGHIVQGHVDGTGVILARRGIRGSSPGPAQTPATEWEVVRISVAAEQSRYLVKKGSIAVDGISLTVSDLAHDWFEVSLIPETLRRTTLGAAAVGDSVNLEVDLVAKYVERLLPGSRP
jgi:riboflavin synthase